MPISLLALAVTHFNNVSQLQARLSSRFQPSQDERASLDPREHCRLGDPPPSMESHRLLVRQGGHILHAGESPAGTHRWPGDHSSSLTRRLATA
jgi:hypothetical protein